MGIAVDRQSGGVAGVIGVVVSEQIDALVVRPYGIAAIGIVDGQSFQGGVAPLDVPRVIRPAQKTAFEKQRPLFLGVVEERQILGYLHQARGDDANIASVAATIGPQTGGHVRQIDVDWKRSQVRSNGPRCNSNRLLMGLCHQARLRDLDESGMSESACMCLNSI